MEKEKSRLLIYLNIKQKNSFTKTYEENCQGNKTPSDIVSLFVNERVNLRKYHYCYFLVSPC